MRSRLAIHGGPQAVRPCYRNFSAWPQYTRRHRRAVLTALHSHDPSSSRLVARTEEAFATWHGVRFALATNSGTAAIHSALFAANVSSGDEVICPSFTYWGAVLPVLSLGARVVFADVSADTLTLDPADVAQRITSRTRAVVGVHLGGFSCAMGEIQAIAREHGLSVIEDAAHAAGGLYQGQRVGTLGDLGVLSLNSYKSLPCGEGGILLTNDRALYERAIAFGHYRRTTADPFRPLAEPLLHTPELSRVAGLPLGGVKYRIHPLAAALALVDLTCYSARLEKIQAAMSLFWDLLDGLPGLRPHRLPEGRGSTMGGWYNPHALYVPEELGGLDVARFCAAVRAEGSRAEPGSYAPLHLHPLFAESGILERGQVDADAPALRAMSLPVTESLPSRCLRIPWFRQLQRKVIEEHARAYRKVIEFAHEI